jgi:hypothetical protein
MHFWMKNWRNFQSLCNGLGDTDIGTPYLDAEWLDKFCEVLEINFVYCYKQMHKFDYYL